MRKQRYVLEGTWSGYSSSQSRVCHRVIISDPKPYEHLKIIKFTDNTTLYLSIRKCWPRERVEEIKGYVSLINDAIKLKKDFVRVSELPD